MAQEVWLLCQQEGGSLAELSQGEVLEMAARDGGGHRRCLSIVARVLFPAVLSSLQEKTFPFPSVTEISSPSLILRTCLAWWLSFSSSQAISPETVSA